MVELLEQHRDLCVKQGFWHHGVITLGHCHIDELPLVASTEFVADALDSVFDGAGRAPQHASDILGRSATKQEEQHQLLAFGQVETDHIGLEGSSLTTGRKQQVNNRTLDAASRVSQVLSVEKGTAIIELLDTALSAGIEVSPRVVSCALSAAHQHLQVSEKINRSLQIGCGSKEVLRLVD
ncbi:hypothetical protein [Shewanella algae]|uniref:hypothetical protein n=1 Tax=Shewanella algae TaxID=38313 RepID=UPI0031F533D5